MPQNSGVRATVTKTAVVVTSIGRSDLMAIQELDEGCARKAWAFIVVGDAKSPDDFDLTHGRFLARASHEGLPWRLGRSVPSGNYSLKNLGYLTAIAEGHDCIVETDDDNIPRPGFWEERSQLVTARGIQGGQWVNIYSAFTTEPVWPRGLPLDEVRSPGVLSTGLQEFDSPVQMALADDNPDVDAIYRLIGQLPVTFAADVAIACTETWTPFNSQNTSWFQRAFPLLYLPTNCSFRMTDIWRSFVAMAWMRRMDWPMVIQSPTVYQVRNDHDLLEDFRQEVSGYLNNKMVMSTVAAIADGFAAKDDAVSEYLPAAYKALADLELVAASELDLVNDWLVDLSDAKEAASRPLELN
jgi:hypothetical protein